MQNQSKKRSTHVLSQVRVTPLTKPALIKRLVEIIKNKQFTTTGQVATLLKCSDTFVYRQKMLIDQMGLDNYINKNNLNKPLEYSRENRALLIEMIKEAYAKNPDGQAANRIRKEMNLSYGFVYPIVSKCRYEAEQLLKNNNNGINENTINNVNTDNNPMSLKPKTKNSPKFSLVGSDENSVPQASHNTNNPEPTAPTKTINDLNPGDTVLVSDNATAGFVKRIFLAHIPGASNSVVYVRYDSEENYKNGLTYKIATANHFKMAPDTLKMTKEQIANMAGVNVEDLEIIG